MKLFTKTQKKSKNSLVLKRIYTGEVVGRVGSETVLKDIKGTPLYVGDVVEIYEDKEMTVDGSRHFVCHNNFYGDYVMSIALSSSSKYNSEISEWFVRKVKDYKDLVENDVVDFIFVSKE